MSLPLDDLYHVQLSTKELDKLRSLMGSLLLATEAKSILDAVDAAIIRDIIAKLNTARAVISAGR